MAEIALLDAVNLSARSTFEDAGLEVATFEKSIDPSELAALTDGALALGVRSGPAVNEEAISDSLEAIAVFGVGTNHIERAGEAGADARGVAIFNSAHENTRSVAELVIGGTFALFRDFGRHNSSMHEGVWTKEDGRELRGKTMGIVGYGNIGAQVSVMAENLGMDVVAFDPAPPGPPQGRATMVGSLEDVLETSDVVTLHAPGNPRTRHMIDSARIKLMQRGSYLINAARGDLVDYEAVADALESGQLGGVLADVYTDKSVDYAEPSKKGDSFEHVLRQQPNALLLPHIGGSTAEAQQSIGRSVAGKVVSYLQTGDSSGSVNFPNLALATPEAGISRLLNVHDNHPGVVAELTALISDAGLNIAGQNLATTKEMGYVAFDLEGPIPEEIVAATAALEASRSVRTIPSTAA